MPNASVRSSKHGGNEPITLRWIDSRSYVGMYPPPTISRPANRLAGPSEIPRHLVEID